MLKNLVIVESPAKAKTIEGYLGKDFIVKSSYGHVRDLPKGDDAIDIANNFAPRYEISDDKKQVVRELQKLANEAEIVWLATDDDREGEAISWHLKEALGLTDGHIKRIVFREITKNAIIKAIQSPRTINEDLVNAQQARRVLDRLVGFELSPILWRKIKSGLSAGRVQSVAVRLVVEREREVEQFESESVFKVTASFRTEAGKEVKAEYPKRFAKKAEAQAFLESCKQANYAVSSLEKKPAKKSPAPPFTTSTLQQEASRKLSYPVATTMSIAQKLYEAGHITYMRTDSVNLSDDAMNAMQAEISKEFGPEYSQRRNFKTKSQSAQEAHEAIRPTDCTVPRLQGVPVNEQRLYELIWKRALASQMADALLERTNVGISISTNKDTLVASGEIIKFDGFLKLYLESTDEEESSSDEENGVLPPLTVGQVLLPQHLKATERYSRPAPRYTEASLVKKLEEMGIGRPSTYAPTISTIIKREYVLKDSREGKERNCAEIILKDNQLQERSFVEKYGSEKSKLFPTSIGSVVSDFLVKHFPAVVDYSFTAKVEEQFDQIANGKIIWSEMLRGFYTDFHATVETTAGVDRASAGLEREIGIDPASGKKMVTKMGRYGAYVQIGTAEDTEKPVFASLRKGQHMDTITLADALELFKLPRAVGSFEGKEMVANLGRFGPFVRHDGKFFSLAKEQDPLTITEEEAIALIENKREEDIRKLIKEFEEAPELKILNGRWGPYMTYKGNNYKIPKSTEAAQLSLDECMAIIAATDAEGGPKKPFGRTAPKKAEPAKEAEKPAAKKPAAKSADKPASKKAPSAAKKKS